MTALTMEQPKGAQGANGIIDGLKNFAVLPGMPRPGGAPPPQGTSQNFAAHKVQELLPQRKDWRLNSHSGSKQRSLTAMNSGQRVLNAVFPFGQETRTELTPHDVAPRLLRDREEKPRRWRNRRAPFHPRDFFLGTTLGQYCLLGLMVIILVFGGALTWMAIGGTPELPPDFGPSLWISWGLFFDPGTQTSMDPTVHQREVIWTAIIFSIFGYWLMLTNMAMIVEVTRAQLVRWEKEHWRVRMVDHIVILGWTEKTIFFIKELINEAQQRPGYHRQQNVVILAEEDVIHMRQSIDGFLPRTRCFGSKSPFQFICREGSPHDPSNLEKVSVTSAQDIIVLGQAGNPRDSDLVVARLVLALASLPEELSGRVLAEVRCADTSPVLEAILLTHIEGIHSRSTVNRMLCLMACKPVVGDLLSTFSSFAFGEEMYCVHVPPLVGSTFAEACRYFHRALCIGIKPPDGQVVLAPEDDRVIASTDRLLLIAEDEDSIGGMHGQVKRGPALERSRCSCCCRRQRGQVFDEAEEGSEKDQDVLQRQPSMSSAFFQKAGTATGAALSTPISLVSRLSVQNLRPRRGPKILTGMEWDGSSPSHSQKIQPSILNMSEHSGSTFVIIGWPEDLKELLQELDCYVRDGCQVHVLSDRPIAAQKELLARAGLINIEVRHHSGSHISVQCLTALPLAKAHSILVLSEMGAHQDAFSSDSSTIACAAMICGICEGKYGPSRKLQLTGRIICEVLDARSNIMLQKNPELMNSVKFFKSNALETGLFAMATSEPTIFNILVLLLCPTHDIGKLVSVSVTRYLSEESKKALCEAGEHSRGQDDCLRISYWGLHERVRQHPGEMLIGWHRSVDGVTRLGASVDRDENVTWTAKDRLLVIRNNTSVPRIVDRMSHLNSIRSPVAGSRVHGEDAARSERPLRTTESKDEEYVMVNHCSSRFMIPSQGKSDVVLDAEPIINEAGCASSAVR